MINTNANANTMETLNLNGTLDNIIAQALDIQADCSDKVTRMKDIKVSEMAELDGLPMSVYARGELCGKLKIPGRYITQCMDNGRADLAAKNIRDWMDGDERPLLLRKYKGRIRGVLGAGYSKLDSPDVLSAVKEALGDMDLKGFYLDEERLHARLVEKTPLNIEGTAGGNGDRDGDVGDLFAGVTIDSSDVGRSALQARFFIYKKVCTNGLMLPQSQTILFRQRHVGIKPENFKSGLLEGLKSFESVKDGAVEIIDRNKRIPLPADLDEVAAKVKAKTGLGDEAVDKVLAYTAKYSPTLWGLVNGLTEAAQEYTLERRIQLEEIAGGLLK